MKNIFTIAYSEEEANEIGHFIMSKGYEGVQNDSYRYCALAIKTAFHKNKPHNRYCIYIGVGYYSMIVSHTKRCLRRKGMKYIEKKRMFYKLLDYWYVKEENNQNKIDALTDNVISCMKIHEESDKKFVKRIRLMPEIKKNYEFVAKDEKSVESEYFCHGFVEGADWRINSIWHDVSEKPKKNDVHIAVLNKYGIKTDFWCDFCGWEKYVRLDKIEKWAYIDDLLPTTEE